MAFKVTFFRDDNANDGGGNAAELENNQQQQAATENQQAAPEVAEFEIDLGIKEEESANQEAQAAQQQAQATPQSVDWREQIKNVKKEDLLAAIGVQLPDEDDEFIKNLREHRKNGGDPAEYLYHKTKDWDKEDDYSLLEAKMKREYPKLSQDKIEILLADAYGIDDENAAAKHARALGDAEKERAAMKELQSKFKIAERIEPAKTQEQQPQDPQILVESIVQQLSAEPEIKSIIESKKVAISIEGVGVLKFPIPNPERVLALMAGDPNAVKEYRFKDGKPNIENEMFATLVQMYGIKAFVKGIANMSAGKGKESLVDELANIGKDAKPTAPYNGSTTSNVRAVGV